MVIKSEILCKFLLNLDVINGKYWSCRVLNICQNLSKHESTSVVSITSFQLVCCKTSLNLSRLALLYSLRFIVLGLDMFLWRLG